MCELGVRWPPVLDVVNARQLRQLLYAQHAKVLEGQEDGQGPEASPAHDDSQAWQGRGGRGQGWGV